MIDWSLPLETDEPTPRLVELVDPPRPPLDRHAVIRLHGLHPIDERTFIYSDDGTSVPPGGPRLRNRPAVSMVDRVARRICEKYGQVFTGQAFYLDIARVAIEAMSEPTSTMLSEKALFAGFCQRRDEPEENFYHDPDEARQIWKAMIAAALNEDGMGK